MAIEQYLEIICEETGVQRNELDDDAEFADLGIDNVLAKAISTRFVQETSNPLSPSELMVLRDVRSLINVLEQKQKVINGKEDGGDRFRKQQSLPKAAKVNNGAFIVSRAPIMLPLQGDPSTAEKILFLLPDGSGSAMGYARLPRLGEDTCLCGLNSPFLGLASFSTRIEDVAAVFASAIRDVQAKGPYLLGGWSAGGLYATEVARNLMQAGGRVESIVLIDSPCPLEFTSLPLDVVHYLAERNLMGNWGSRGTPQWLLDHFHGTLNAIDTYKPMPLESHVVEAPVICILEAAEGVFASEEEYKVAPLPRSATAKHLLAPRPARFDPLGWERLFPHSSVWWARTSGHHFTMVHHPHNEQLGILLKTLPGRDARGDRRGHWSVWRRSILSSSQVYKIQ